MALALIGDIGLASVRLSRVDVAMP